MKGFHLKKNKYSFRRRKPIIRSPFRSFTSSKSNLPTKNITKRSGTFSIKRITNRIRKLPISFFKFSTIPKVFLFTILCIFGYLIYRAYRTSYFNIKQVNLTGNELVSDSFVIERCNNTLNKNIFTISVSRLENELKESSIYVKSAHVEKVLPDTITIIIEERKPTVVWRTINGAYLIDDKGFVLERALNEEITIETIQDSLLMEIAEEVEEDSLAEKDENNLNLNGDEEQNEKKDQPALINLDEDIGKLIDWELKRRENEINLFKINYDDYLKLPDLFKKYPQIKVWSDEILSVGTYKGTETLERYLLLNNELNNYSFDAEDTIIFSEDKALINFKDGFKVYFKLDSSIYKQVNILSFIYNKLRMEGMHFQEIDLRFKRPIVRE